MSFVLRAARPEDLPALYQMAKSTGGGFTNLPPDRPALKARLARAATAFAREDDTPGDDQFLFILEDAATGLARGTCQIFARTGSPWPFYSYRMDSFSQYSRALARTIRAEMLTLSTELGGCTEVGGLFLSAGDRSAGAGGLLARSRYLFIREHRARFAERTIAELRGAHDEAGGSPFWDGLAGRFFGMSFREADEFNARHGNQFIADLMPRHPIYVALLAESAQAAIGVAHQSGRAAQRMLETEGFAWNNFIDIFDGGPTMTVATDAIATVRAARSAPIAAIGEAREGSGHCLVAYGRLGAFRACYGQLSPVQDGVMLDPAAAQALRAEVGDRVTFVPR